MATILQTTCAIIQTYFSTELLRADTTGCSFPTEQRQNARHLADEIFKLIFILTRIPIEFVPKGPSKGMSGLV